VKKMGNNRKGGFTRRQTLKSLAGLGATSVLGSGGLLLPPSALALPPSALDQNGNQLKGLNFLWLEITPRCNLHCQHCYVESSPHVKDPKIVDWQQALVDGYNLGCRRVQFIGGEPTYKSKLLEYIRTTNNLGYDFIEVYTNLTLLTDDFIDKFSKCGVNIATSFYSSDEEIHDCITGVKGSFKKTVNGIEKILSNKIPLRIGIVTTDINKHEFNAAKQFLIRLGVDKNTVGVDQTRPVGRGLSLTPYENLGETLCGSCWKGKLAISWDGNCYPCVFARNVNVGNILTNSLSEIIYSEELKKFRKFSFSYKKKSIAVNTYDQCKPDMCRPVTNPIPCDPVECAPDYGWCMPDDDTPDCSPDGTCPPDDSCTPNEK
jgi:radical SAM protein with 4Fe4S-binding SPASM domain